MGKLRFAWWMFWARRSRWRIALMCMLLALTVLAIVWLALPVDWRRQAQNGATSAAQWVGSLDTRTLLVALIGLCVVEAFVLLFIPSYRKHSYLATTPALIPLVTVYVDAENTFPVANIKPFSGFLMMQLKGQRADLLYFQDAALDEHSPTTKGYKSWYLAGFRPVDVPHNPTGRKEMGEAVDREIALHAYERALLGPKKQRFIFITEDGDYVPIIYRLVALGHLVEIWAPKPSRAYEEVKDYLGIKVVSLAKDQPDYRGSVLEQTTSPVEVVAPGKARRKTAHNKRPNHKGRLMRANPREIPTTLTRPGERKLYWAISETISDYQRARAMKVPQNAQVEPDQARKWSLYAFLGTKLKSSRGNVGYSTGSYIDYWLSHLTAIHVFEQAQIGALPQLGKVTAEDAACRMYAMAQATAGVAAGVIPAHADGIVHMYEIADAFAQEDFGENESILPLVRLIAPDNGKRVTHTRYFIRSARALGLLRFDDVPGNFDETKHLRLPGVEAQGDEQVRGEDSDDAHAADKDDDAPPTLEEPPIIE